MQVKGERESHSYRLSHFGLVCPRIATCLVEDPAPPPGPRRAAERAVVGIACRRMIFEDAMALLAALEREGVRYVMIGSMAMAANGIVRATRDIDFMVAADEDNIDHLRVALRSVFDDPSIDEIDADDLEGAYPVVQYLPPDESYSIDIIARLGEAYVFDDIEWHWMDVEGLRIKVATPSMLYAMKRNTVREQDRLDAQMLRQRFGDEVD